MVDAGVFYGRKRSRTHPRMKRFILSNRNEIEIIDLAKTKELLETAQEFIRETMKKRGNILFVGTQPAAVSGVTELAKAFDLPYVTTRWLGGMMTNFRVIGKRIEHYLKLKNDWQNKAFEAYTKKERVGIERELNKLEELFFGLSNFKGLPAALIIIDPNLHMTAVREAKHLRIPVVSFVNTDSDPELVQYPVVGNNKAKMSIDWFLRHLREAFEEGKRLAQPIETEMAAEEKAKA